jgi:5-methylcytosine-specific restriction endonuclease McrA
MTQRGERYAATQKSEVRYNTGKPCVRGHFADRWTKTGKCIQCAKEERKSEKYLNAQKTWRKINIEKLKQDNALWRKENKDRKTENDRQWRINNIERKRENDRKYYEENKEEVLKKNRKYAKNNPEVLKKAIKKWQDNNPHLVAAISARRRARMQNAEGFFTGKDIQNIFESQNFMCVGCDSDLKNKKFHVDHIMPLSLGGSNWPTNLQILCPKCNLTKHAKHPDDWIPVKARKK